MKNLLLCSTLILITSGLLQAQLSNGGFHAKFGVDADTRTSSIKYGPETGPINSDDWFATKKGDKGVLDTTNAFLFRKLLQSNRNISFTKNMSVPLFSKINGMLWLDAIYMRDYTAGLGSDSTAFGTAAKNGVDPRDWDGKPTNIPGKTDFVDTYAHFRRNGTKLTDSLWFFTGISTVATQGERYFDVELFKNSVSYNKTSGTFASSGLSFGHTEWIFDPFGNILQSGDLIIAVSYNSGQAPVIDVRIWVSKTTFTSSKPKLFKFGPNFDSGVPGNTAGYATILSKAGSTVFGSGIGNYSSNAAADSTYSTPWGTSTKTLDWSANYETLQFVEIGLNFTRMGLDPTLYTSLFNSACDRIFHSIFFKSRSSNSFSANLQDFAGPINFSVPGLDYKINSDTLNCLKDTGFITLSNISSEGVYSWSTETGSILSTNTDSSSIMVNGKGFYRLDAILAAGCPQVRSDLVEIRVDSLPPVAYADMTMAADGVNIQLIGGDTAASNKMTPFGRSKGLMWNWKGPNNFTATIMSPVNESMWAWGTYQITLTEKRNGCKAMASVDVGFLKLTDMQTGEIGLQKSKITPASENMYILHEKGSNNNYLVINSAKAKQAKVLVHNTNGQLLGTRIVQVGVGYNKVQLPAGLVQDHIQVVTVLENNRILFTKKIVVQ
ncbi:MAG TPA: hypothetical protein VM012_06940 [Flavitalea sp.]|nr:hypothetical protein [Flavitalea sp.]